MVDLRWDGDDFNNSQDSSGATADQISHNGKLQQGYRHGSLTHGLVAYYPMEKGEGEVLHDGAFDNLAQKYGSNWSTDSVISKHSINFNGGSDFIDTPLRHFAGKKKITVSAWIKIDSTTSSAYSVCGVWNNNTEKYRRWLLFLGNDGTYPRFYIYDGSSHYTEAQSLDTNTWYHISGVYNGEKIKIYVNGQESNSKSLSTKINNNEQEGTRIGRHNSGEYPFDGKIEDVRIYDRALSEPEIQALYNLSQPSGTQVTEKQVPGQDQGGVSRYKFNGDVKDSWGNNDGTNNGVSFEDGIYGQSGSFQKSNNDYVDTNSSVTADNPVTVSCWTLWNQLPSSAGNGMAQVSNYGDSGGYTISSSSSDDKIRFQVRNSQGDVFNVITETIEVGKWYHLTGTIDNNGKIRFYVNGRLSGTTNSTLSSASNNLYIGNDTYGNSHKGKIDDVRIYNTALTPQQIEKLYYKGAYRIPRESTLQ